MSGKNDSRDWWSFTDIPVEPWFDFIAGCFCRSCQTSFIVIFLGAFRGTKEIEYVKIPVKAEKGPARVAIQRYPILYPHRVLAYLFDEVGVNISPSVVQSYWGHARAVGEGWATNTLATDAHIPIGIHGDSARLESQITFEKHLGVFMNLVLWRPRSVRYSRFLIFSMPSAKVFKNRSLNEVFRVIIWSLNAALDGVHPSIGPRNRPLVGVSLAKAGQPLTQQGLCFALTELRGDWEWHRDVWRPTAAWNTKGPVCPLCPALREGPPEYCYFNAGPGSHWIHECFDTAQFIALRLKEKHLCSLVECID